MDNGIYHMEGEENERFNPRLLFYLIIIIAMSSLITVGVIILMESSPLPSYARWFLSTLIGFLAGSVGILYIIYRVEMNKATESVWS
jgi:hypothetical protein